MTNMNDAVDEALDKIDKMSVDEFEQTCIDAGYKPVRKNLYEKRETAPLHVRMIAKANDDNLLDDHPMRTAAVGLNKVLVNRASSKKILGAWARARRIWCNYTGEPLI